MEDFTGLFHLDSNVIDDRCNNTTSSFKNYLSSTYRYNNESYEAGLVEIHIPFTWINVEKDQYICLLDAASKGLMRTERDGIIPIKAGYYLDIDELLDHCNEQILEKFHKRRVFEKPYDGEIPEFISFDPKWQRVVANVPMGPTPGDLAGEWSQKKRTVEDVFVLFTSQLASILGYTAYCFEYLNIDDLRMSTTARMNKRKQRIVLQQPDMHMKSQMTFPHDLPYGANPDTVVPKWHMIALFTSHRVEESVLENLMKLGIAQRPPYIAVNIEEAFIYCSLIKPHAIGNSYKQLLRVTPVTPSARTNRGESVVITYNRPYYFPLYHSSFDYIEIELRDRAGELIEFESGGVLAIVEIRRRKHAESFH